MPQKAREDLLEWNPKYNIIDFVSLLKPLSGSSFDKINSDRNFIVTDNRPYNEYFFLADLNFQNSKVETNTKSWQLILIKIK